MSRRRWQAGVFLITTVLAGFTLAAGPAESQKKAPIPDAAARAAALKQIRYHYHAEYDSAEKPDDKAALAKKMVAKAIDGKEDAAERYTLLRVARDMAADAGDMTAALEALGEMDKSFQIDVLQSEADTLEKVANSPGDTDMRDLFRHARDAGGEAVLVDRYDVAKQYASIALRAAKRTDNKKLLERALARAAKVDELQKAFDKLADARAILKKNPTDPTANLAVGKFRCFAKGDWTGGLPLLAIGGDAKLKMLAELDLSRHMTAETQLKLADGWWEFAQNEPSRAHILLHAANWYKQAQHNPGGPELARVEQRINEMGVAGRWTSALGDIAPAEKETPIAGPAASARKRLLEQSGGNKESERAVAAALWWFAHHQMKEGNWSLKDYTQMCKDGTCAGPASEESLAAATALGLLPFLAAGQTHQSNGPFKMIVSRGIYWLLTHQKEDGDLYTGGVATGDQPNPHCWMYSHGMATMALCECYGMTGDKTLGEHAQLAVDFIQKAQNKKTGGWRYRPGDDGDTSVLAWQLMALKSALMAGLKVDPAAMAGAQKWLESIAVFAKVADPAGGDSEVPEFAYRPGGAVTPTMTAIAVLCDQAVHPDRRDPMISGSVRFLMQNLPDEKKARNIYYWYFATQALHNMADKDWDTWNRRMRDILVRTQIREGCASGSWDPIQPTRDAWGRVGGRIMMTSLSALTLEVYYRSLPLCPPDNAEPKPVAKDSK